MRWRTTYSTGTSTSGTSCTVLGAVEDIAESMSGEEEGDGMRYDFWYAIRSRPAFIKFRE